MPVNDKKILKAISKAIKSPYDFEAAFDATMGLIDKYVPTSMVSTFASKYQCAHSAALKWMAEVRCGNYAIEVSKEILTERKLSMPDFTGKEFSAAMPFALYQPFGSSYFIHRGIDVYYWYYGLEEVTEEGAKVYLSVSGSKNNVLSIFGGTCFIDMMGNFTVLDTVFSRDEKEMMDDIILFTILANQQYQNDAVEWAKVIDREEQKRLGSKKKKKRKKVRFPLREMKLIKNLDSDALPKKITYLSEIIAESNREEKALEEAIKSGDEKSESWWKQHYRLYWIHPRNKEKKRKVYEAAEREVIFLDDITRGEYIAMVLEFKRKLPPIS